MKLDMRFDFVSNLFPVSSEPSLYYRKGLSLFQQLFEKHDALPDDLSCKNIQIDTLLFSAPSAAPGCATFWESVVGRPINRSASVWRKSRLKIIENKKNDLLWLLLHRVVRVRYNLKNWGYIDSDKCATGLKL